VTLLSLYYLVAHAEDGVYGSHKVQCSEHLLLDLVLATEDVRVVLQRENRRLNDRGAKVGMFMIFVNSLIYAFLGVK
jgi:hypothetical protein